MTTFIYNGHDLADILDVAKIEMPAMAPAAPTVRDVPGMDGAAYCGTRMEPMEIRVRARLATCSTEPAEIQRQWARVAALLRSDEPAPLTLAPGLYRMAVLQGATDLEFYSYSAIAELSFLCPDPVAYGDERTVTVPSGGSATFNVGGTYPAKPVIEAASAVRDGSSLVWGVRLDAGDVLQVATGSESARKVVLDCAARTCAVAGATALPTLASDWFELAPGDHTIENHLGSGACTVAFRERWV